MTKKGTVLTQMSKFWFDMTGDILPNHMISTDVADMPEFFRQPQFDGNSMMCRKLNMHPHRMYCPGIHHRKRLGQRLMSSIRDENGRREVLARGSEYIVIECCSDRQDLKAIRYRIRRQMKGLDVSSGKVRGRIRVLDQLLSRFRKAG